jgi:hypothetical protein
MEEKKKKKKKKERKKKARETEHVTGTSLHAELIYHEHMMNFSA